ncbi:hypothetical protein [Neobacillus sp. CF12]|uniref:hypothetical protein n=1 Tax=Neobacillus sp. CF12 TaxID=3055864 RepID=UPI0025A29897|nr:hypothetical protein [Neobacillus sp. CF12]MDM5326726.1 hypothetical protein [Neobacillus sp. CF12]
MGIRCTACGLIIPNVTSVDDVGVVFFDPVTETFSIVRIGSVTYDIDVCADDLQGSFVTINFVQTSGETPDLSFTFNSVQINSIQCVTNLGVCDVVIEGSGQVEGETETRPFIVAFAIPEGAPFSTANFTINTFDVSAQITFPSDEITTFGCF